MVIVGTDLPLGERQLKRVLKRAAVGLIRTGSFMGHGSGDVFIGFTNANGIPDTEEGKHLDAGYLIQYNRYIRHQGGVK